MHVRRDGSSDLCQREYEQERQMQRGKAEIREAPVRLAFRLPICRAQGLPNAYARDVKNHRSRQ
jgi:hypothetical protein